MNAQGQTHLNLQVDSHAVQAKHPLEASQLRWSKVFRPAWPLRDRLSTASSPLPFPFGTLAVEFFSLLQAVRFYHLCCWCCSSCLYSLVSQFLNQSRLCGAAGRIAHSHFSHFPCELGLLFVYRSFFQDLLPVCVVTFECLYVLVQWVRWG